MKCPQRKTFLCTKHVSACVQITNLSVVTEAASEAAYLYAELAHMGADMRYLDCGGGLGIDYDGTASESHCSLPFSIQVGIGTLSVNKMWTLPTRTELLLDRLLFRIW